jgi:hypothetical protein
MIPQGIIEGKDGFLFQTGESVIELLTNKIPITTTELGLWLDLMRYRIRISESLGSKYLLLVAPEKHVIYEHKLPDGIAISKQRASVLLILNMKHIGMDMELLLYIQTYAKNLGCGGLIPLMWISYCEKKAPSVISALYAILP